MSPQNVPKIASKQFTSPLIDGAWYRCGDVNLKLACWVFATLTTLLLAACLFQWLKAGAAWKLREHIYVKNHEDTVAALHECKEALDRAHAELREEEDKHYETEAELVQTKDKLKRSDMCIEHLKDQVKRCEAWVSGITTQAATSPLAVRNRRVASLPEPVPDNTSPNANTMSPFKKYLNDKLGVTLTTSVSKFRQNGSGTKYKDRKEFIQGLAGELNRDFDVLWREYLEFAAN